MNRARLREGARNIVSACQNDLGECEAGGLNNVVTALLTAIQNLADVSQRHACTKIEKSIRPLHQSLVLCYAA